MSGPSWVADAFAALMIVITIGCACRLVAGHLRFAKSEPAVDGLHILMGAAMAGMFEPRFNPIPGVAWRVIFAVTAAWFAWQAIRVRTRITPGNIRPAHPLPHAVESVAMIYMLQTPGFQPPDRAAEKVMAGMSGPAGASDPIIPLVLALFILGYIIWTADRLASMQPSSSFRRKRGKPYQPVLGPRLAACYKIVMGIAMGYMLVTML